MHRTRTGRRAPRAHTRPITSLLALLLAAAAAHAAPQLSGPQGPELRPDRMSLWEPPEHAPGEPSDPGACDGRPRDPATMHLASGEFHLSAVDLRIRGRGLDLVWARTYRSRSAEETALGWGWDYSYDIFVAAAGAQLMVGDGNGRRDLFAPVGANAWAADGFFRTLERESDGGFTMTFPDGGEWRFFPLDGSPRQGRIRLSADRNGNTITFGYDAAGRLVRITDTLARDVTVEYDGLGRISSVTDFAGRQVKYEHYSGGESGGGAGDLKSVRSPVVVGTPNGNDFPAGKTTVYTYSKGTADERLDHNLLTVTDPRGTTWLRNGYAATKDPTELAFDRLQRQAVGEAGDVIHVRYFPVSPADGGDGAVLLALLNDRVGNVSERRYDARGRCVTVRRFTGRADPDQPTTTTHNRPVDPLRPDDPPYFETRWEWNADSLPVRVVYPNGNSVERVHELELDPQAPRRARGNLRELRRLPGPLGGDQPEITETFEYDAGHGSCCGSSFVTRHVDPLGRVTENDYDARGNLVQTRYPIPGIVEDFEYDAHGRLVRRVHPGNARGGGCRREDAFGYYGTSDGFQDGYLRSETVDAAGSARTTTYEYDLVGNVVRAIDPRGHDVLRVVNALDQVVRERSRPLGSAGLRYEVDTTYDANDNVVRRDVLNVDHTGSVLPNAYLTTTYEYGLLNERLRETVEVDETRDVVTAWEYDANRNVTLRLEGEATNGNQPANAVRSLWDERDLPFREVRAPGDPLQSTAQRDYDGNGNEVRAVEGLEAGGHETLRAFDGYDRLVVETDPMGNAREHGWDACGNEVASLLWGENLDLPGGSANVRLFQSATAYDELDRPVRKDVAHFDCLTQAPIGDGLATTLVEYADDSSVVRVIDDAGNVSETLYDCAKLEQVVIDPKGNRLEYEYDANSNVTRVAQVDRADLASGTSTIATDQLWDALDRQVMSVDQLGNVTAWSYDARDDLRQVVDQRGNVVLLDYDGLQRLTRTTRLMTTDGTGSGGAAGEVVTTRAYDDSSRLIEERDPNGNATRYAYDPLDRRVATVAADGSTETYQWNAHDELATASDPNGSVVESEHDLIGRVTGKTVVLGPTVLGGTWESFAYDGRSRLVRAQDDDSLVTRSWDSLSDVLGETQNGRTTSCTFDGVGNHLTCTWPAGRQVRSDYDGLQRKRTVLEGTRILAAYDFVGRRVERKRHPAGATTTDYSYDGLGRAVRATTLQVGTGALLADHGWSWDAMDQRVSQTDLRAGGPQLLQTFAHDSCGRLRHATVTSPTQGVVRDTDYVLDAAGNRSSVTGDGCAGAYVLDPALPEPADAQMNQYTRTPCDFRAYDANGNLASLGPTAANQRPLGYDFENRLVYEDFGAFGAFALYGYDPLDRLITKTVVTPEATVTTEYAYHGWQLVEERDGGGNVLATWVWGNGLDEVLEMQRGATETFFHADPLGSVRLATGAGGSAAERYDYGDFGAPSFYSGADNPIASSAIGNPFLFAGARRFSFGYLLRHRVLDPLVGRFVTRDPIGAHGDLANLGNAFTYAANAPQTHVDPLGLSTRLCSGPWSGARAVEYESEDCGPVRKQTIKDAICPGYRAAATAHWAVKRVSDFYAGNLPDVDWGDLATELRVHRWFGGNRPLYPLDDEMTLDMHGQAVRSVAVTLGRVYRAFRDDVIDFECESSCDAGTNAYVPWGPWPDLHFCPAFFGRSRSRRTAILLHEMTHMWADTDDEFYYSLPADPLDRDESPRTLRNNADTYEEFLLQYYIE